MIREAVPSRVSDMPGLSWPCFYRLAASAFGAIPPGWRHCLALGCTASQMADSSPGEDRPRPNHVANWRKGRNVIANPCHAGSYHRRPFRHLAEGLAEWCPGEVPWARGGPYKKRFQNLRRAGFRFARAWQTGSLPHVLNGCSSSTPLSPFRDGRSISRRRPFHPFGNGEVCPCRRFPSRRLKVGARTIGGALQIRMRFGPLPALAGSVYAHSYISRVAWVW
jgi:hypothetical protein